MIEYMSNHAVDLSFIESLTISPTAISPVEMEETRIDLNSLPKRIIAGGNLIAFGETASHGLREDVALNLLFAQEAAKADPISITPDLWIKRHDMVLKALGWASSGGESETIRFSNLNTSLHEAIIPLLVAALGPGAAAGALIITGLRQLQEMEKDEPWITLYEQESKRLEHNEYRFATVESVDGMVYLRMVALRLKATDDKLQVLFFRKKNLTIDVQINAQTFSASTAFLEKTRPKLEARLLDRINGLIADIPLPAFG